MGVEYFILLLHTLLISLNVKSTLSSRCIYQYQRLSQSTLLISLNIEYAVLLSLAY